MNRRALAVICLTVLALASAGALLAEDQPTVYTRVGLWQVKREMWPAFVKYFEKYDQPVMEKMMAAGVINEWGIDATALHSPEGYTHSTWYAATSYAALAKVDAAYEEQSKKLGEKESARVDAEFAAMITKHRDDMLSSVYQRASGGRFDHAVYFEGTFDVNPDQGDAALSYFNEQLKPTYQKLMDDGVVLNYGLYEQEIATESGNSRGVWYVVKDAAGIDAVKAAFKKYRSGLSGEQKRQRWAGIKEMAKLDSYRQHMSDMIHWAIAKQ